MQVRPHGVGNVNPLQYSCLENNMNRETWWTAVHGVTKSQTQLSMHALFSGHQFPHLFLK